MKISIILLVLCTLYALSSKENLGVSAQGYPNLPVPTKETMEFNGSSTTELDSLATPSSTMVPTTEVVMETTTSSTTSDELTSASTTLSPISSTPGKVQPTEVEIPKPITDITDGTANQESEPDRKKGDYRHHHHHHGEASGCGTNKVFVQMAMAAIIILMD